MFLAGVMGGLVLYSEPTCANWLARRRRRVTNAQFVAKAKAAAAAKAAKAMEEKLSRRVLPKVTRIPVPKAAPKAHTEPAPPTTATATMANSHFLLTTKPPPPPPPMRPLLVPSLTPTPMGEPVPPTPMGGTETRPWAPPISSPTTPLPTQALSEDEACPAPAEDANADASILEAGQQLQEQEHSEHALIRADMKDIAEMMRKLDASRTADPGLAVLRYRGYRDALVPRCTEFCSFARWIDWLTLARWFV